MVASLFQEQRELLTHFFETLEMAPVQNIFDQLLSCKGSVIFSGVGKSGHIAQKCAATFSSTGTRSFFLDPTAALHGDIGQALSGDIALLFSKSGQTQEILQLGSHLKKRGVSIVAIVSNGDSTLAKLADYVVVLPVKKELCPHDLAPTTSTTVQLIFGDCLAVALMKAKKFSLKDFAANHPSGVIGRKITAVVEDLMLKGNEIPKCRPEDKLLDVLHELTAKKCGCLVAVNEKGLLQGIFTDGDLRRAIQTHGPGALQMKVADLMTKGPKSIAPKSLALEAVKLMEGDFYRPITVLPVLEEGKIVGLVRIHDILQKEIS